MNPVMSGPFENLKTTEELGDLNQADAVALFVATSARTTRHHHNVLIGGTHLLAHIAPCYTAG
jgi:hypothetical protein